MYHGYLNRFYIRNDFEGLSRHHGVQVEQVKISGVALARYMAKLQEGASVRLQRQYGILEGAKLTQWFESPTDTD